MRLHYDSENQSAPRNGLILLQGLVVMLFCIFALRFWYLQIHKGEVYAEKSRANRLRQESMYAPRGLLRDRDGTLLAINEPAYALAVVREDCKDINATLEVVSRWTGLTLGDLEASYKKGRKRVKAFEPQILVPELSPSLLAVVEANALRWPGLEIVVRPKRYYSDGELMAHVIGYVAEASENELEDDSSLALGDAVGKSGMEVVLEKSLRGEKGLRQMEVDASGRRMNELVLRDPEAGRNIMLSIDVDLQRKATEELDNGNYTGAVVVLEPMSGEILALVTRPSFDNNVFVDGLTSKEWSVLRDDPRHPLQNRATQSMYPPGSVFKLVMAGSVLDKGHEDENETVYCSGSYKLGNREFRCWKKHGHGKVDLRRALVESCDVYFYEMGKRLGIDNIETFAKSSGFGNRTGIDLPHEKGGLIPSRKWKRKRFGQRWQGGDNLNTSIGQGYTLVTPLQVARFLGALLNGGKLLKPQLVAGAGPEVQSTIPWRNSTRITVLSGMRETVETARGTARRLRMKGCVLGGKTGTAQVFKLTEEARGKKTHEIEYKYRDHSWIASWGIKDDHAVVVVCMVEHGGHGGEAAVPVAKAMYDYMFANEKDPVEHWPMKAPEGTVPPMFKDR